MMEVRIHTYIHTEFPYETIEDAFLMTISMAEMNHFGTRPRAAILLTKNPLTKPTRAPNHFVVQRDYDETQLI